MADVWNLLYFDTFSHENIEELNIDLVQFPKPVVIHELRIVPLGKRVLGDFTAGSRLGGTSPLAFKLEVFANNSKKPDASVFEKIGVLDYDSMCNIVLRLTDPISTDGLIIKGWYTAVTLAILGNPNSTNIVRHDQQSPPPPPPPQKPTHGHLTVGVSHQTQHRSKPVDPRTGILSPTSLQQPANRRSDPDLLPGSRSSVSVHSSGPNVNVSHSQYSVPPPPTRHGGHTQQQQQSVMSQQGMMSQRMPMSHQGPIPQHAGPRPQHAGNMPNMSRPPPPMQIPHSGSPVQHSGMPPRVPVQFSGPRPRPPQSGMPPHVGPGPPLHRGPPPQHGGMNSQLTGPPLQHSGPPMQRGPHPQHIRPQHTGPPVRMGMPPQRMGPPPGMGPPQRPHNMPQPGQQPHVRPTMAHTGPPPGMTFNPHPGVNMPHGPPMIVRMPPHPQQMIVVSQGQPMQMVHMPGPQGQVIAGIPPGMVNSPVGPPMSIPLDSQGARDPRDMQRTPGEDYDRTRDPRNQNTEKVHEGRDKESQGQDKKGSRSMSPSSRGSSKARDEETEPGEIPEDIYDTLSPENEGAQMFNMSDEGEDGEIQEADGGYEEISDDEMLSDIEGETFQVIDYDIDIPEDAWNSAIISFNPYQCELVSLSTLYDVSLTPYEVEWLKLDKQTLAETPESSEKILDVMSVYKTEPHTEEWVEALEDLASHIPAGLPHLVKQDNGNDVLSTLVDWTFEGLDIARAMAQPETTHKIRHLKMGIKLAGYLTSCSLLITNTMLCRGIQEKLLELYNSQCMSVSLKIQLIRALDLTTCFREGMEWFLGKHPIQLKQNDSQSGHSNYQTCLDMLLTKQSSRVFMSITSLLRKANTFEVLESFKAIMAKVSENLPSVPDPDVDKRSSISDDMDLDKNPDDEDKTDSVAMDLDQDPEPVTCSLTDGEVEAIIQALEELLSVFVNAAHIIAQPRRTLPTKVQFISRQKPYDPYPNLYHFCQTSGLLESMFVLLSSSVCMTYPQLFRAVKDLLQYMLSSQEGLLFLSSKPETVTGIMRALTTSQDEARDEGDDSGMQQFGLQMIYYLQTLQYVDQLNEYHQKDGKDKDIDDAEPLAVLHNLYSMTFSVPGREAAIHVLGLADNIQCLLPFLTLTDNEETNKRLKKSVSVNYTAEILMLVVRHSDSINFLKKYGTKLLQISETDISRALLGIKNWYSPLKTLDDLDYTSLPELISYLKLHGEDILSLPRGIVTTLRIIHHLAVDPNDNNTSEDRKQELCYNYAILELHSADCFPVLMGILQKVSELQLLPWQRGIPKSYGHMSLVMSILKPSLAIVKATLQCLIQARGSEFKDLTSLPILFNVYNVVCSVPVGNHHMSRIQHIHQDILDTLLAFTQPTPADIDSDEALASSLWTVMLQKLMDHTLTTPYTFVGGLSLLSELLPIPLPIQTKQALSTEEVHTSLSSRKLWSAHLHPLNSHIQNIITVLAGSSCASIQHVLRRVCWQLADLATPTAQTVVRCLLDLLMDSISQDNKQVAMETINEQKTGDESSQEKTMNPASGQTARILNLLSSLMSQPPIKAVFFHLTQGNMNKTAPVPDGKYSPVLSQLLTLLNVVSEKPSHVQAQECIVSIIQSLCDPEISMVTQLSNALPDSCQMSAVCSALLEHVGHRDHGYSSILPTLRSLVMLTEHDYGFYHIKTSLDNDNKTFYNLLMRINSTFSKDSSDCLSSLSTAMELIRLLLNIDPVENENTSSILERTMCLTIDDICRMLDWSQEAFMHPLDDLEKLLMECSKEEEALESLLASITELLQLLKKASTNKPPTEMLEPELPRPETLSKQFDLRLTFIIVEGDDGRLSPSDWLTNIISDDIDQELDMVKCNLEEMSRSYCPGFDLRSELRKGTLPSEMDTSKTRKKILKARRSNDTINTSKGTKRVAPMRGRGFGRGLAGRGDMFRSRPPNTSRPPSMHVDDFMKIDAANQDEGTIETITGLRPSRPERGRGRGFDRGGRGRGRFFSPPGSYRRDESSRGGFNPSYHGTSTSGHSSSQWRNDGEFTAPSPRGMGRVPPSVDRYGRDTFRDRGRGRGRGTSPFHSSTSSYKDSRYGSSTSSYGRREMDSRHQRSFTK